MAVLHSKDLVNRRTLGGAVSDVTQERSTTAVHLAAREALRCFPCLDEGTHDDPYSLVPEPEQPRPPAS